MRYYAVKYKDGETDILYGHWEDVAGAVIGKKGATFKGFGSKREAEEWLGREAVPFRDANTPHKKDMVYVYVDGAYTSKVEIDGCKVSGWGFVIVKNEEILYEEYGTRPDRYKSRNITGELHATIMGIMWVNIYKLAPAVVVHDYAGIANWALGYWGAKSEVAKNYCNAVKTHLTNISFEKVRGHQGVKWNEYADALAKKGIEELKWK